MKVGDKVYIWWASSKGVELKEFELKTKTNWGFQAQSDNHILYVEEGDKNLHSSPEEAKYYLKTLTQ